MITRVDLGAKSYAVHVENGLLSRAGELMSSHRLTERLFIITDEAVRPLYGDALVETLRADGFEVRLYAVPVGEPSKCLAQANALYTHLLQDRADRNAVIIALGGGVVGDLAGFVAATFMRGVRFVQIPTTLLAQVDSSVGGKVGINHPLGKNLIGAFHQPQLVIVDPQTLKTLPPREIRAGAAEVIKYGLIRDRNFYELIAERLDDVFSLRDIALLERVINTGCAIKADVVSQDEREVGLRAILNFGHTVGHAIEAVTGYQTFLHGEAVVHGMKAALYLSHAAGHFSTKELEQMVLLLNRFEPPPLPAEVTVEALLTAMQKDKKRSAQGQLWVLLKSIGEAYLTRAAAAPDVVKAVSTLLAER